jgi:hypothetical protein
VSGVVFIRHSSAAAGAFCARNVDALRDSSPAIGRNAAQHDMEGHVQPCSLGVGRKAVDSYSFKVSNHDCPSASQIIFQSRAEFLVHTAPWRPSQPLVSLQTLFNSSIFQPESFPKLFEFTVLDPNPASNRMQPTSRKLAFASSDTLHHLSSMLPSKNI